MTDICTDRVKALRLLNNASDLASAVQVAMRFESQIIANSPSEVRRHFLTPSFSISHADF